MRSPVVVGLPLACPCLVQNSPASRVPSHGTDVMASTYAIDLVPVDARGRRALTRDWRTLLATEPPDRFVGFGAPVVAPVAARVAAVHDGEPDHDARRSPITLVPYALGQARRLRRGAAGLAGNHVVLDLAGGSAYLALAHLRCGSLAVAAGEVVVPGQLLGTCGSSGNSTEPHLHLQAMDAPDPMTARGVPLAFTRFRERRRGGVDVAVDVGLPATGSIVEPAT